jgi:predicted nucleic acid-binding protein
VRHVLDSGGLTRLVADSAQLRVFRRRTTAPFAVPTVVLTESLTGDHRRDFHANRLLRTCEVFEVDELLARRAASLRSAASGSRTPSAVDAIVVALAEQLGGAMVLTSDPRDLRALARYTVNEVRIA